MTRACKFSLAVAGLCGSLLATPAAAQSNDPCRAERAELFAISNSELETNIRLKADKAEYEQKSSLLKYAREQLPVIDKSVRDLLVDPSAPEILVQKLAELTQQRDQWTITIKSLEPQIPILEARVATLSNDATVTHNRHFVLTRKVMDCDRQAATPTSAPAANTNAGDTSNVTASGRPIVQFGPDQPAPAGSPAAGTTPTTTAPAGDTSNVTASGRPIVQFGTDQPAPAGSPAAGTTAAAPDAPVNLDGIGQATADALTADTTVVAPLAPVHYDGPGVTTADTFRADTTSTAPVDPVHYDGPGAATADALTNRRIATAPFAPIHYDGPGVSAADALTARPPSTATVPGAVVRNQPTSRVKPPGRQVKPSPTRTARPQPARPPANQGCSFVCQLHRTAGAAAAMTSTIQRRN